MQKPIQRTKFRILLGKTYYRLRKNYYRHLSKTKFANERTEKNLNYKIFSHKTPLLRKLKDVDMELQYNKIENLKIAIRNINGTIIKPGEIFSYRRSIGEPTTKKGYKEGVVLKDGKFERGTGGGLCQLSNLIYRATIHTPLSVTERWRHSYDVFPDIQRTQPFGSGATCSYPAIDLQIQNTTSKSFQLKLWLDEEYLHGAWYANQEEEYYYEVFEKEHKIESQWRGGHVRSNKIFRKKIEKKTDTIVEEEFLIKNNAIMMYNPMLE